MAYYRKCPLCGANLDPGEQCDCTAFLQEGDKREPEIEIEVIMEEQKSPQENKKSTHAGCVLFVHPHQAVRVALKSKYSIAV